LDTTIKDPAWHPIGRAAAWINAFCYFGGALLYLLVDLEITWSRATFASDDSLLSMLTQFFVNEQDRWPQELTYTMLFTVGFLSLIPIGLVLRDHLGRDLATSQMVAASLLAAGVIGAVAQLALVGGKDAILEASRCTQCQQTPVLASLNGSLTTLEGITRWVSLGYFLLAGTGILFASWAAFDQPAFSSGWVRLGTFVGLIHLAGVIAVNLQIETAFQVVIGLGAGVLVPVWSVWLALQLKRFGSLDPPEENAVPAEI
jgi:hypothetical protein